MVIMWMMSIPISFIWWNAESILLMCGQHPEITSLTKIYCRWMIPGLLPLLIFECFKKYLQTQGKVVETLYALVVAGALNVIVHYYFIYYLQWGFVGGPIALCITYVCLPFILLVFVKMFDSHKDTWYGWSWKAMDDWMPFLKMGVPGMLMYCAEWWASEVIALAAGFIGDTDLAAQSVVTTTNSIIFMIPLGISVAVNTRVGNLLGAGQPEKAKKSMYVAFFINFVFCIVMVFVLALFRNVWGHIFTNDQEVVNLVEKVLIIYAIAQIFDGTQGVAAGVLRGLGKQNLGFVMNFISYYLIGLPTSLVLAFPYNQGIFGLWWGLLLAFIACSGLYFVVLIKSDWKKEALFAQERVREELEKLKVEFETSAFGNLRPKPKDSRLNEEVLTLVTLSDGNRNLSANSLNGLTNGDWAGNGNGSPIHSIKSRNQWN